MPKRNGNGSGNGNKPIRQVVSIAIAELKPYEKNARRHSKNQIDQIVKSLRQFGWTNPVLIDENKRIIAGHCRVEAARILGMEYAPCIVLEGLTDEQKRAYVIADNKLALNAEWCIEIV